MFEGQPKQHVGEEEGSDPTKLVQVEDPDWRSIKYEIKMDGKLPS